MLNSLTTLINEYAIKFAAIPENELTVKPAPGKWSKKEITGHLIDLAQNNIQRFVRAQYEIEPHIVYRQDEWVAAQHYQQYNGQQLVNLWSLLNRHICIIPGNLPLEVYSSQVNVGKTETKLVNVQFLAEDY